MNSLLLTLIFHLLFLNLSLQAFRKFIVFSRVCKERFQKKYFTDNFLVAYTAFEVSEVPTILKHRTLQISSFLCVSVWELLTVLSTIMELGQFASFLSDVLGETEVYVCGKGRKKIVC